MKKLFVPFIPFVLSLLCVLFVLSAFAAAIKEGYVTRGATTSTNTASAFQQNASTIQPSSASDLPLLANIRQIFAQCGATRLSCKQLVAAVRVLQRPGSQASNGNPPVTSRWLGHRLHRLGISPRSLRIGPQSVKGYELTDFSDAFARFLKS